ncbi:MAG: hypothetical protein ABR582_13230 [Gemmatimonadaceae bacterium]
MLLRQVALISDTKKVRAKDLNHVSAALQKQVTRDFAPIWDVSATVDSFPTLEDMPVGYWPVIIMEDIRTDGAGGVHEDKNGQPFALVQLDDDWALTASHECLEMLADPSGNRLTPSASLKKNQGKVSYLVEVCDPCEDAMNAYTVNGISMSDFYTPQYFDPKKVAGVRYSYTGAITAPRQVLPGGYLSWTDPATDSWWQARYFTDKLEIVKLRITNRHGRSLRSMVDAVTGLHLHDAKAVVTRPDVNFAVRASVAHQQQAAHRYTSSVAELRDRFAIQPASHLRGEIQRLRQAGRAARKSSDRRTR